MDLVKKLGQDSLEVVDHAEKTMGFFTTFSMWLSANLVVTTIYTGMYLVPDLPLGQALWIILSGSIVGAIPLALVGSIGTRTGLTTMAIARSVFGTRGSILPSVINMVLLIGWSWVQALMAGISMDYAIHSLTGYSNVALFTIICECIVVFITLSGHKGIEIFEKCIAAAMLALSCVVFYKLFGEYDWHELANLEPTPKSGTTVAIAIDMVIATAISWTPISADYNRNCKSVRISNWGTITGYVVASLIAMGTGAIVSGLSIMSNLEQTFDPTVLLSKFGFGLFAAFVIFFSVMTTNIMCVYSATMSYMNVRPKSTFWKPALVIGVISVLGALYSGILDNFSDWILTIGGMFTPIFAIMLSDYYFIKKRSLNVRALMENEPNEYWYSKGCNVLALGVYVVTALLSFYWIKISPLWCGATIPSFVVAFLLYILACKLFPTLAGTKWG
ncbi:putative allantoin permease [Pseudodesulfovibrio hydrargyri]|uniref:Putative allantoin permease n=1 Tax=Pseudodesulfovibrio hydrargyri TaxID=2125990 RepID=A0A1J5MRS6_9BACT|nr:cytosine permease [Pseudodesulfovibrio hydrargyri]OIQ48730.1 putative allantoin permease [Pseudodesulfovibrio hydrargyri]